MKEALIIFVRNLVEGKVKTRLSSSVGEKHALEIYEKLVNYTKQVVKRLEVDTQIYYSDQIEEDDLWNDFGKFVQHGDDLGLRMANSISEQFKAGYRKMCIIGSDNAEITPSIINKAFNALEDHDLVIGPAVDGGYYLIGMNKLHLDLFIQKSWGTSSVLEETLESAGVLGLNYSLLESLNDIDDIHDLKGFNL